MKKLISILSTLLLLVSCDLIEKPYTVSQQNLESPEQFITGIYDVFWSSYLMKKTYMECIDMDHDLSCAHSWVLTGVGNGNMTTHWSYNSSTDPFNVFYKIINRANFALENIDKFTNETQEKRNSLMGEAYFLRAYAYFHLVRMYGKVPLRLTFSTPTDMVRSSVKDIFNQIVADLDNASKMITNWGMNSADWGHASKTAAILLMAKAYATMGSGSLSGNAQITVNIKGTKTLFTTDVVTGYQEFDAQKCYKRADSLATIVIGRKGLEFDLKDSYLKIWGAPNFRNNEFVWGVVGYNNTNYTTEHLGHYYSPIPFNGRGYAGISTHAYNLYEATDDRGLNGVFHYFQTMYSSITAYGYYRFPDNATLYPKGPNGLASRGGANTYMVFTTKWFTGDIANPVVNTVAPGYSFVPQDVIMLRFAEAYLIRAEARNEMGNSTGAIADIDVIRGRAKATLKTGTTTDKTEIRSLVFEERARELMQEFNRKFDLLRWGLYLKVMNATGTIAGQNNAVISKTREPRSVLYAAPTDEVLTNKLFGSNNEGW